MRQGLWGGLFRLCCRAPGGELGRGHGACHCGAPRNISTSGPAQSAQGSGGRRPSWGRGQERGFGTGVGTCVQRQDRGCGRWGLGESCSHLWTSSCLCPHTCSGWVTSFVCPERPAGQSPCKGLRILSYTHSPTLLQPLPASPAPGPLHRHWPPLASPQRPLVEPPGNSLLLPTPPRPSGLTRVILHLPTVLTADAGLQGRGAWLWFPLRPDRHGGLQSRPPVHCGPGVNEDSLRSPTVRECGWRPAFGCAQTPALLGVFPGAESLLLA